MGERPSELLVRYAGPILTLLMIALTELAAHVLALDSNVGVLLFLFALVPIAYSGLKGGLPMGIPAAAALSIYTLHYTGPHGTLLSTTPAAWRGAGIVLALGIAMAIAMSRIKVREDRFRLALERRARDLEQRNAELTDANAALQAFGYVVSHDLKEPVRALENYLDVAREEWPSEEARECLDKAYAANERLSRLLHGLLDYSRTSSLHVRAVVVDVDSVLRSDACAAQYQAALRERGGELVVRAPLPPVLGDEVILAQLLGNVVLNAFRHNHQRAPRVEVRAGEVSPGRVHLVVADNGPGFPSDVVARFQGLRENRPATIKTGFGLVIAHRAAQRLSGRIWLENPREGGGEVHLDLPAPPPTPEREPASGDAGEAPSRGRSGSRAPS